MTAIKRSAQASLLFIHSGALPPAGISQSWTATSCPAFLRVQAIQCALVRSAELKLMKNFCPIKPPKVPWPQRRATPEPADTQQPPWQLACECTFRVAQKRTLRCLLYLHGVPLLLWAEHPYHRWAKPQGHNDDRYSREVD